MVLQVVHQYKPYLPQDRTAPILELGIGDGWFIAACLKLGYQKIYGADFGITHKHNIRAWAPDGVTLFDIPSDIGEFLSDKRSNSNSYTCRTSLNIFRSIPFSGLWTLGIELCSTGVPS